MKLLISEAKSDYANYLYPYAIWAMREAGEAPAALFNAGFLPTARDLDRFYLCRHIRVTLGKFKASSENRRILRKGEGITMKLVPRAEFELTPARREFCRSFADARFGKDVMPSERVDLVFNSPVITHVLVFNDAQTGAELGVVVLYLEAARLAFYRFAFYELNRFSRSLGLFMMTSAVGFFAAQGFAHLYLGTCYSDSALYKTQFAGVEFFNGFRWSENLGELKYVMRRDQQEPGRHLLENETFRQEFYDGDLAKITAASGFQLRLG